MDWLQVSGIVAGSTALPPVVNKMAKKIWGGRKTQADSMSVLVKSALDQVTSLEKRYDELVEEVRALRRQIGPYQRWGIRAYQRALQTDPDFDPPPDLFI